MLTANCDIILSLNDHIIRSSMSLTISEWSIYFERCHCLPQFFVLTHFQITKTCYYCPGYFGLWRDKRQLLLSHRKKNALRFFVFVSSDKIRLVITISKAKQKICRTALFSSKQRWYTNKIRTLWNILLRDITEHMLHICESVVLIHF